METENTQFQNNMTSGDDRIRKIRVFCMSRTFMILTAALAALFVVLQAEVVGAVVMLMLISALLVVCDDALAAMLPFLSLCIMVLQCYDSFDTFIRFIWLAPIPIGAIIFHFVSYAKPFKRGFSLWGILAVSVATTLGGLGTIDPNEYFAPIALFYVVGLGFGMAGAYMLIKSQLSVPKEYDLREKFTDIMYIAGLLACFQMFEIYGEYIVKNIIYFSDNDMLHIFSRMSFSELLAFASGNDYNYIALALQPGNNVSTFIMLSMPFVFYRAAKGNKLHLLTALLFAASLLATKSRGGILCGGIEFLLCLVFAAVITDSRVWKWIFSVTTAVICVAGIYIVLDIGFWKILYSIISTKESRARLIKRSLEDFASNPIFGKGLGCRDNFDLYAGKKGTIIWYHMMIPQIVGSMGTVGILAYGWQFFTRVYLTVKKYSHYVLTLAMSYVGLLLMSQVNPGEFCPLPYGLVAVMLFILIENEPDRVKNKKV